MSIATLTDVPALSELLTLLFTQEADFRANPPAQIRGLSLIINHPEIGFILKCEQNQRIVGMVNMLLTVSTAKGAKVGILEDMIVDTSVRGTGVGSALIEAAINLANKQKVTRITLLTDQENVKAQHFYTKFGFKHSAMTAMRLNLDN